jgi:hypothetical protein
MAALLGLTAFSRRVVSGTQKSQARTERRGPDLM